MMNIWYIQSNLYKHNVEHMYIIDLLKYIYDKIDLCNNENKMYESIEKIDNTIDIRTSRIDIISILDSMM